MVRKRRYERLLPEQAEEILVQVLSLRDRYSQYQKPDDVNALLSFFPRVRVRQGYALDYELVREGEAAVRIRPFARPQGKGEIVLSLPEPPEEEGRGEQAVETLYQYLEYEHTPQGLFEYAFFVSELWAVRASQHEAEWLASTPIFTQDRFDELVSSATKVEKLSQPDWYGPEVALYDKGGGKVRFLVHTPVGWERVYFLEISVSPDGRIAPEAGKIVADLGRGEIF